ncbi:MAG: DNA replication/repair protein RecF [Clostridia bacterium]
MKVTRLKLNYFRNYTSLDISPGGGINVIIGDNAQGKTNAIEAIFLCALARSHRTPRDAEMIMNGCAGGYAGVDIRGAGISHSIEIKLIEQERKKIFVDKQLLGKTGELMGIINVVMFSPEDLSLVKQGPAERRRFMDMELCQLQPAYYYRLQQYNTALRQRNAMLKGDAGAVKPGMLVMWDEQLATLGESIMNARSAFIDELSIIASNLHNTISGDKERLAVYYMPNVAMDGPLSLHDTLMEALMRNAAEDMRRGFTAVGPHRDDIGIRLNDTEVRVYGSQGQQRTAALSIKLSEFELMRSRKGESPVLLLDDVFSELDASRSRLLLTAMEDCQCFLTCTSLGEIKEAGFKDMSIYNCAGGVLKQ